MNSQRIAPPTLALFLLLVGVAQHEALAEPAVRPTASSAEPLFQALLKDGTTVSGRLRQLGPEGKVILASPEGGERSFSLGSLVKLTRDGDPPAAPVEGSQVLFPEGDRLRATIGVAGETAVEVIPPALGEATISVPLDALVGVILNAPSESEALDSLLSRVRREARNTDVLWLANGDRLSGSLLELTPQKVRFQADAGPSLIDRTGIVGFGFDPAAAKYPRPRGDFLEVTLSDGSRLGVADARIEGGGLRAMTRFGVPIRVPIGELARVHVRSDKVAYLSETDPAGVQYEAYVARPRVYRRDANVEGGILKLAGQPYDRGIGTQSRTLLAYWLGPADRRFQALLGLDDKAGPLGSVVFRVRVDGKDKFVSPVMTARDAPKPVDIDVSGAKVLILMTEFGERGEVRDFADWIEARLIR